MKDYINSGDVVTMTAPYAVASGGGVLVGALFGVATSDAENGAEFEMQTVGVFALTKTAGASTNFALGGKVYWDNTAKAVTGVSSGNTLIGTATKAAATGDTVGYVRLGIVA